MVAVTFSKKLYRSIPSFLNLFNRTSFVLFSCANLTYWLFILWCVDCKLLNVRGICLNAGFLWRIFMFLGWESEIWTEMMCGWRGLLPYIKEDTRRYWSVAFWKVPKSFSLYWTVSTLCGSIICMAAAVNMEIELEELHVLFLVSYVP